MERVLVFLGMSSRRRTKDKSTSTSVVLPDSGLTRNTSVVLNIHRRDSEDPCFDEMAVRLDKPDEILRRMLSTRMSISKPCYMPAEDQTGPSQIGKGQCGAIWALDELVLKVPNEGKQAQLWNDCCHHKRVEEAFQQAPWEFKSSINIPTWRTWIDPSADCFWAHFSGFFPEDSRPTYGILSDRIQPMPDPICHALIGLFAPKSVLANTTSFLARPENKDSLMRLYLNRRGERSASAIFKLRNFDLLVNEMEHLGLDTANYAQVMAQALAVLHWKARIDANAVEFVLGRSPKLKMAPTVVEMENWGPEYPICSEIIQLDTSQRSIGIWLLDFDQCQTFSESDIGVTQLQRAFYFNDPYYPRPISRDPRDMALWKVFRGAYLGASTCLTASDMPRRFIEAVEEAGQQRAAGGSMFQ